VSNYPPGVTGNEPQIAGYPEGARVMTCSKYFDGAKIAPVHLGDELLAIQLLIQEGKTDAAVAAVTRLTRDALDMPEAEETECGFEGEADCMFGEGMIWWTCPRCDQENETEMDDERDEDDGRDR
jgi:hypothetical protein